MSYQFDTSTELNVDLKRPQKYVVVMHNDDYTSMEFVVDILIKIFNKNELEASRIMLAVHKNGWGIAGSYTYDIAMTKKIQTERLAEQQGFPLKITLDEAIGV